MLDYLGLPYYGEPKSEIAVLNARSDSLMLYNRDIPARSVPNVLGMGLRDAIYLLENMGLQVEVDGIGKVERQSLKPGTPVDGQTIRLSLG